MTPVFHPLRAASQSAVTLVLALAAGAGVGPAQAQVPEDTARQALQEVRTLITEGTGVIGDLQPMINSGKVDKEQVSPEALTEKLKVRYQKATQASLDTPSAGLAGEARRAYLDAYRGVLTRYQSPLAKGGQDAFVPAYFRALVLKDFNQSMKGRVQAYATNRDAELINGDWAVQHVMKGSPLMGEVQQMMVSGSLEPVIKRSGDKVLGYWPMKLGSACVSCHAQNGLKQAEGAFGGALVAEVPIK